MSLFQDERKAGRQVRCYITKGQLGQRTSQTPVLEGPRAMEVQVGVWGERIISYPLVLEAFTFRFPIIPIFYPFLPFGAQTPGPGTWNWSIFTLIGNMSLPFQAEIPNAFYNRNIAAWHLSFRKFSGQNFASAAIAIWLSLGKIQTES